MELNIYDDRVASSFFALNVNTEAAWLGPFTALMPLLHLTSSSYVLPY